MSLTATIAELKEQRNQLNAAIAALESINGHGNGRNGATRRGGPRVMSAAARRRIVAAQKARWAKWRRAQK